MNSSDNTAPKLTIVDDKKTSIKAVDMMQMEKALVKRARKNAKRLAVHNVSV